MATHLPDLVVNFDHINKNLPSVKSFHAVVMFLDVSGSLRLLLFNSYTLSHFCSYNCICILSNFCSFTCSFILSHFCIISHVTNYCSSYTLSHFYRVLHVTNYCSCTLSHFYSVPCITYSSGFTALTEKYSLNKKNGTAQLTKTLNGYMGALVQEIISYDGDVIKYAGDAILCIWEVQ